MNTRLPLSAALAAAALFVLAPAQAQAPTISSSQLDAKIQAMQSQINALQAQVQQLQQQLHAVPPSRVTGPAPQMPVPKFTVPKFTVPSFTIPNTTLPNMTPPNNPQLFIAPPPPSRDNSIPNYTATFISHSAR